MAAGTRIPVVFITAHDDAITRERARRAGAVAYLPKPFDDASLIGAIHLALGLGVRFRRSRSAWPWGSRSLV